MYHFNKFLIVFFLTLTHIIIGQTFKYNISSGETPIGKIEVTKTENKNNLQIDAVSDVRVKLFITIDLKYKLNCTYKNKELLYSSVTTYVNGKMHSTSTTEKKGDYYTVTKDGHTSKFLSKITYSGALLYFIEPKGVNTVYSEFHTIEKPINKTGTNTYQITNPKNGRLSDYTYINGILKTATIHHKLMTFTLTKI